jgi:hypothetical protein
MPLPADVGEAVAGRGDPHHLRPTRRRARA